MFFNRVSGKYQLRFQVSKFLTVGERQVKDEELDVVVVGNVLCLCCRICVFWRLDHSS